MLGATYQPRGGIARHENVAWGYARAADALGVDLVQGCEVTGIDVRDGRAVGGRDDAAAGSPPDTVALVAAGHSSVLAEMAGVRLPIQSHPLQALVSELYEQVLDTVVMSNAVHVYVSQAHKGELVMGAGIDAYNSYAQRGSFHVIEHQLAAALELFPIFAGARVLRTWAGIVDVCPDASPIVGPTPVDGPLRQLRLGHGRLQGDARLGLGVRAHARARRAARARTRRSSSTASRRAR